MSETKLIVIDEALWNEQMEKINNVVIELRRLTEALQQPRILTHKQAAAYLGYSTDRLHDLKNERKIPYSQCGRKISYRIEDLDQFLEEYRVNKRKY